MNADVGGNCELTQPGSIVEEHGVTIIGIPNLPGTLANTASMLYSNNMTTFVTSLVKDGELTLDLEDDILVGAPEGDAHEHREELVQHELLVLLGLPPVVRARHLGHHAASPPIAPILRL